MYLNCWIPFGIKDEDVGIVYQDKETMAAVLVNHDAEDDALILVWNTRDLLLLSLYYVFIIFLNNEKLDGAQRSPSLDEHIYSALLCLARDCVGGSNKGDCVNGV